MVETRFVSIYHAHDNAPFGDYQLRSTVSLTNKKNEKFAFMGCDEAVEEDVAGF